jgi:hypothetical protein
MTCPLVIAFRASLDDIYVDGRDFLVTAFQLFDRGSRQYLDSQRDVLAKLFGPAVLPYFDKSSATEDMQVRIALGNIACFDRAVIEHHYSNRLVIAGRYGTFFRSAFFVKAPVASGRISGVDTHATFLPPANSYSLQDFFSGAPF